MTEETSITEEPAIVESISIVYFCRECQKPVTAKSMGKKKKYTFKCPDCSGVCAYGTSRGIKNFFRIKDGDENWNTVQQEQPKSE